jgi:tRNA pseudouridine55 synthase
LVCRLLPCCGHYCYYCCMGIGKKYNFIEGEVLLFNKPFKWTSFDVVNKIRLMLKKHLGIKKIKVGHAGTLDPLATGLLVICTGKATKTIAGLQSLEKEYEGTFTMGATTPSYDLETEVDEKFPTEHLSEELIQSATKKFTGKIQQLPPVYSAKRINGKKAYYSARKGEKIEMRPNEIEIAAFHINKVHLPEVDFEVACSKGTYVRSLAYDFGKELGSGAYLSRLVRTKVAEYSLADAWELDDFEKMLSEKQ